MTQEQIDKEMAKEIPEGQTRFTYLSDEDEIEFIVCAESRHDADVKFMKWKKTTAASQ